MNLIAQIADFERRLRGLKAKRNVNIAQVNMLRETFEYELTIEDADAGPAIYEIEVECADDPIVDVGIDGLPEGELTIVPSFVEWSISGNTATANIWMSNITGDEHTVNLVFSVWGLNGLSATSQRTL